MNIISNRDVQFLSDMANLASEAQRTAINNDIQDEPDGEDKDEDEDEDKDDYESGEDEPFLE